MSQTVVPHCFDGPALSAPGKAFLLGEYAVLAGRPAALLALGPRFRAEHRNIREGREGREGAGAQAFAALPERSPAGKLLRWAYSLKGARAMPDLGFFVDPFRGQGGFGASTAQYLLAYEQLASALGWERTWQRAWKLYRELSSDEPILPSGADLVCQAVGGISVFSPERLECHDASLGFDSSSLLVFSATAQAGRKVATHEHLRAIAGRGLLEPGGGLMARVERPLADGIKAIEQGSPERLGKALTAYAEALFAVGLESEAAHADRLALQALPGVLGAKGTGAMLADGVVACVSLDDAQARERVLEAAASRGLGCVFAGQPPEAGMAGLAP